MRTKAPPRLKQWRWPPTPWYNGFTSAERIRGWQIQWFLMMTKHLPNLNQLRCEVCGTTTGCHYHLENYFDPLNCGVQMCGAHHSMLHRRFRRPGPWEAALTDNGHDLDVWAKTMSQEANEDWATPQVEKYGEDTRTCTFYLPDELKVDFPWRDLHPMEEPDIAARDRALFLRTGEVTSYPPEIPTRAEPRVTPSGRQLALPMSRHQGGKDAGPH